MRWQKAAGVQPSVLFNSPGFALLMVCIDVLHALDLGITQDMLGNLFWESLGTLYKEGRTKADRLNLLWNKMKKFYKLFYKSHLLFLAEHAENTNSGEEPLLHSNVHS